MLLCDRNIIVSSSEIFCYLRKSFAIFGKCSETIVWPSENFKRIFGNLLKAFGNLGKIVQKSSLVSLYNKQNNTWLLVDMEFLLSCLTWHLIRLLRLVVRNSISTHVLSSLCNLEKVSFEVSLRSPLPFWRCKTTVSQLGLPSAPIPGNANRTFRKLTLSKRDAF